MAIQRLGTRLRALSRIMFQKYCYHSIGSLLERSELTILWFMKCSKNSLSRPHHKQSHIKVIVHLKIRSCLSPSRVHNLYFWSQRGDRKNEQREEEREGGKGGNFYFLSRPRSEQSKRRVRTAFTQKYASARELILTGVIQWLASLALHILLAPANRLSFERSDGINASDGCN
jgi:hypothetical protein